MGSGIAGQLLKSGLSVRVWNRTAGAADGLVGQGAQRADTPADAVEPGGIAITMLANDAAVRDVAMGPHGFTERLGAGGVHVSMSTISVELARALAERQAQLGGHFVAAPVFGRPEAAAAGKLWVLCSGDAEGKARVRPVLETLSQGIFDIGEAPEAAVVGKIAGNFLIASAIESMSEAFALLQKRGVDARMFHDVMSRGLFSGTIHQNYGRFILDEAFTPAGFKLALGAKDVGLALAAGGESSVPLPFASVLRDRFLAAIAQGRGDLDWTAIALNARAEAGLPA
jgi:3-hydroxyisobutyrate dehydrogenase-like beta-hydroxyacid dehydrogenase